MNNVSRLWAISPHALEYLYKEKAQSMESALLVTNKIEQGKAKPYSVKNNIAEIAIENALYRSKAWYMPGTTYKEIKAKIEQALADDKVQGILYSIYSPGGTVAGTQELASFIKQASQKKPSLAFVDGMACSAAYWLASATGKIIATESAELGSIGVVLTHQDYSNFNEKVGIKYTYITAGSKKSIGASDMPLSEQDKDYLQNKVNLLYEIFLQDISQNMGLDLQKKETWADGRVFIAKEAISHGLVTQIVKTKEDAIQILEENIMSIIQAENLTTNLTTNSTTMQHQEPLTAIHSKTEMNDDVFAIVKAVCGESKAEQVKNLVQAGITKEQVSIMASIFAQEPKAQEKAEQETMQNQAIQAESQFKQEMLKAINENGTKPVLASTLDTEQALIERVANVKR